MGAQTALFFFLGGARCRFILHHEGMVISWRLAQVIIEFSSGKLSATTQGNVLNDEVCPSWSLTVCPWKMLVGRQAFPLGARYVFRGKLLNFGVMGFVFMVGGVRFSLTKIGMSVLHWRYSADFLV